MCQFCHTIYLEEYDKTLSFEEVDGCWKLLDHYIDGKYYAFSIGGKNKIAHREIYYSLYPETDKKFIVHHKCENKLCCNPSHLEAMSRADHNRVHYNPATIQAARDAQSKMDPKELSEMKSRAAKSKAITGVKDNELRCGKCKLWKQDDDFNLDNTKPYRRYKRQTCKGCLKIYYENKKQKEVAGSHVPVL